MKSGERRERTVDVPDTKKISSRYLSPEGVSLSFLFIYSVVTRPKEAAPLSFFPILHPSFLSLYPFSFPVYFPFYSLNLPYSCSLFRVPVSPVFTFGTGFAFQPVNKRILYETILSTFCFLHFCSLALSAQETQEITLNEAIALARTQSVDAAVALNELKTAYWEYRTFRADLLPEVNFSGTLPSYSKQYNSYQNEDGSYSFVRSNKLGLNGAFVYRPEHLVYGR